MFSQAHHILVSLKQHNAEAIIIKLADHKPNEQFHNKCSYLTRQLLAKHKTKGFCFIIYFILKTTF